MSTTLNRATKKAVYGAPPPQSQRRIENMPLSSAAQAQIPKAEISNGLGPGGGRSGEAQIRKVLVVEDHQNIANLLKLHLQSIGCEVTLAHDGTSGLVLAASESYDLIILDLMLPGIDGLEICRHLRAKANYTPILILTAKSDEAARVIGLDSGADDYLGKPFSIAELIARVKALFRRRDVFDAKLNDRTVNSTNSYSVGDLEINETNRCASLHGKRLDLTALEYDLLLVLVQNPGRTFTRSQLLDLVWSYNYVGMESTVKSHINRLRTKIEMDPANPKYILTVWGVGYVFAERGPPQR